MCGRYTFRFDPDSLAEFLGLAHGEMPGCTPDYNVAPTKEVTIAVASGDSPKPMQVRSVTWGFPAPPGRGPLINARSETVHRLPTFRDAFRRHRCLVPAHGFYEWTRENNQALPWYINLPGDAPFCLAGIYEPAAPTLSARMAILTTAATPNLTCIHHRMPILLDRSNWEDWLTPGELPPTRREQLFSGHSGAAWQARRVSTRVNSNRANGPELLDPPEAIPSTGDFFDLLQ